MPGSVNSGTVRTLTQGSTRSADIYQGYASGLYRQAVLTLGDTALAVRVVSDVIADECAAAPARGYGEDDVRHRLAESVFRRCQQLASDPVRRAGRPVPPSGDVAGRAGPGGSLSEQERGALGLVLIGGFGYVGSDMSLPFAGGGRRITVGRRRVRDSRDTAPGGRQPCHPYRRARILARQRLSDTG